MNRAWIVAMLGLSLDGCAGAGERALEPSPEPPGAAADVRRPPAPPAAVVPGEDPNVAPPPSASSGVAGEAPPMDARWADPVRAVLARYPGWGRIDDEARWAPGLCRLPRPATAHVSDSDDATTHGDKLYTLYALDPVAYGAPKSEMAGPALPFPELEQVIVKESFAAVRLEDDDASPALAGALGPHHLQPAERDGQRFVAGERRGLYLMLKTREAGEGTDRGWVYATVDADTTTVTAMGVIDSCAGCHREAGPGRLFGMPPLDPSPSAGRDDRNGPPL